MLISYYFIIGTCLGSFITCLADRISSGQVILINDRSRCPQCQHQLRIWQLIPILGLILQRGRCYDCHKNISRRSTLIELLFGTLLVTTLSTSPWQQFPLISGYAVLLFNSLTDTLTFDVYPTTLIIPAILGWWQSPPHLELGFIILTVLLLSLYLLAHCTHQFGLGDVDVLVMLSLLASPTIIITSLTIAAIAALLFSILSSIRRLPFVPFISWGFIISTQLALTTNF